MKKVRVITAAEAAQLVKDGDTVTTGGFVSSACPETLTRALEERFTATGHPRDLTLFFAAGQGHRDGTGGDHFAHEGMCRRVVGGHWDRTARLGALALENKLEAYNLTQGVITHLLPGHRRPQRRHHHPCGAAHVCRPPLRRRQAQRRHHGRIW